MSAMDEQRKADHRLSIETLRRMTPLQRLNKAFEYSEFERKVMKHSLRLRYPDMSDEEIHILFLARRGGWPPPQR